MDEIYFYREKTPFFLLIFKRMRERKKRERKRGERERERYRQRERVLMLLFLLLLLGLKRNVKPFFFCLAKMAAIYYLLLRRELQ